MSSTAQIADAVVVWIALQRLPRFLARIDFARIALLPQFAADPADRGDEDEDDVLIGDGQRIVEDLDQQIRFPAQAQILDQQLQDRRDGRDSARSCN